MLSSTDPVTRYALAAAEGKVPCATGMRPVCRKERLAGELHLRELEARNFEWRWPQAEKSLRFLNAYRHFKGAHAGKPLTPEPWQTFVWGSLEGWVRPEDGRRRYTNFFGMLNRGNGKSFTAGGIATKRTFFDHEQGADGFVISTKKDQSRITFESARQAVLRSPAIRRRGVEVGRHRLYCERTASVLEPLGADADTLDGLRPHIVIADEIHKHATPALIEVMESGMGTRRQPLLFAISTAGDPDDIGSAYDQMYRLSADVLESVVPLPTWFAYIAEADPEDDWTDEQVWAKANPNLGISVEPAFLAKECQKALANPYEQAKFRRLYLGQHVTSDQRYLPKAAWDACRASAPLSDADLAGLPCWIGLDLSSKLDLTAMVIVWRLNDGRYYVRPTFWLPSAGLEERSRRDRVPYTTFAQNGHLELTPGSVIDQDYIRASIVTAARQWNPSAIAFDPWNATQLQTQLIDHDGLPVVDVRQGMATLSEPTKALAEMVVGGRFAHDGHPILNLHAANLRVKPDINHNLQPDKQKSRTRIDGMSALITALAVGIRERAAIAPMVTWIG